MQAQYQVDLVILAMSHEAHVYKVHSPYLRLCDGMANAIGQRRTDEAVQLGLVLSARKAFSMGLVDELCPPEELLNQANKKAQQWLAVPSKGTV